jgi:hypothetical protein
MAERLSLSAIYPGTWESFPFRQSMRRPFPEVKALPRITGYSHISILHVSPSTGVSFISTSRNFRMISMLVVV